MYIHTFCLFYAGGQDQAADDGSTPLRIVSFQPVENYPGQMSAAQAQPPPNNGGGGGMPRVSVGSPVMMPNQATASTYGRPGSQQPQSRAGYQYVTAPRSGGVNPPRRPGTGHSASQKPNCGNCSGCQFKQPYSRR